MIKTRMGRPVTHPSGENHLATLRRIHGWSQQQAADEIGIDRSTVSRIERGEIALVGAVKKTVERLLREAE